MNQLYYAKGRNYEPIEVINDWGLNFNLGNAVKYIARAGRKGDFNDHIADLDKAIDYITYERDRLLEFGYTSKVKKGENK